MPISSKSGNLTAADIAKAQHEGDESQMENIEKTYGIRIQPQNGEIKVKLDLNEIEIRNLSEADFKKLVAQKVAELYPDIKGIDLSSSDYQIKELDQSEK